MKKVFSLLLAVMLVMSLAVPVSAKSLIINGEDDFTISPSGSTYHATDLFGDGFKNIMPGGTVTQEITIKGEFKLFKEDSMKVTMQGVPHGALNPLDYNEKAEQDDGKDEAPDTGRDETIETMEKFLEVLQLKITNKNKKEVIFEGSADKIMDPVVLGKFRNKGSIVLELELYWAPSDKDNAFANRVGEIDWQFTVEAFDDPSNVHIDNPKTGDYIMMAVAVMAVSAAALIIILAVKRKKKK